MVKLDELNLGGNHISDLIPLAELTNLEDLNIGGNPLSDSDLTPLSELTNLVILELAGAGMANAIRRCHDLDKEGWYSFVMGWNVFVLPFAKGSRHYNRFGPPPGRTYQ